ncbi:MAG: hypothetical protein ACRD7E_29960, partial [Bryobacteraceae bacterium]
MLYSPMIHRWCVALVAAAALQAQAPVQELMYGRPVMFPDEIVPSYDKGYLLYPHRPQRLEVLLPGGQPAAMMEIPCPGTSSCSIGVFAVDSAGNIAATIGYSTAAGLTAGIGLLDKSGRQIRFIETVEYVPRGMCFDAGDNLWILGWERDPVTRDEKKDYMLVRKFSREGKEIGRYLPRSLWPRKSRPAGLGGGYWYMRAASDRIGVIIHTSHADNPHEWV